MGFITIKAYHLGAYLWNFLQESNRRKSKIYWITKLFRYNQKRFWKNIRPWKIHGWNIIPLEVWCSDHFPKSKFMGDGCRVNLPLIFWGSVPGDSELQKRFLKVWDVRGELRVHESRYIYQSGLLRKTPPETNSKFAP